MCKKELGALVISREESILRPGVSMALNDWIIMNGKPKTQAKRNLDELEELTRDQSTTLLTLQTAFPFNFFPTIVSVDKKKIDIINRYFFFSKSIESILIADVASVTVETSLLYAKLSIFNKLPMHEPIEIEHLPKSDTLKIRRIIEGLMIGDRENVSMEGVGTKELVPRLEKIGQAKSTN